MANTNDYPLKNIHGYHFTGPMSDTTTGWRTVPQLLRRVAQWMEDNDVQDPEFQELCLHTVFPVDHENDNYMAASVYYRPKESDAKG